MLSLGKILLMYSIRVALIAFLLAVPMWGAGEPLQLPYEEHDWFYVEQNTLKAIPLPYYPPFSETTLVVLDRIKWCESRNDPLAQNPKSTADGLYQILDGTWEHFECEGDKLNPDDNTRCAYKIAQDGLHHWNASKSCWGNAIAQKN